MNLLNEIENPSQLRELPAEQLPQLCADIREYMIGALSHNPGHFGSSMGAVEIIVALHYVFNTPYDRLVWDVGHQAYAHKLLTGRRDAFRHQRTRGGISGFPFPTESEYDTFVCGHAGNSISAALGMAIADMNTPENRDRHTVAVIGDASISNGLAFEGLNNASNNPNNLLIILNDNDMSIDAPVGALHRYLSFITTSAPYNRLRYRIYNLCRRLGLINDRRKGLLMRFNNALKSLISAQQNIFEGLNIRYFGPFDGNDVTKVVKVLSEIKDMKGPRILHLRTKKGKGYKAAEKNPTEWHAPGNFNPATGEKVRKNSDVPLWQEVFGTTLVEMADKDSDIVGISAAMLSGTSMGMLQERFPERTFDVGISEGHAVTFAGGLAAAGKKPFVAIYSSFLQRAYDNIIHDVAIQGLPVKFCIDRAGLVGEDGVTHHGLFDLVYLRTIPNLAVASPADIPTLKALMEFARTYHSPIAIRYPRGKACPKIGEEISEVKPGQGRAIRESEDAEIAILSVGPVVSEALAALEEAEKELPKTDLFDMIWIKPMDERLLSKIAEKYKGIITIEDGSREGGFGSAVAEWMSDKGITIPLTRLGVPDRWITHGTVNELRQDAGIDSNAMVRAVKEMKKQIATR